jgi:hypothetical protein
MLTLSYDIEENSKLKQQYKSAFRYACTGDLFNTMLTTARPKKKKCAYFHLQLEKIGLVGLFI